MTGDDHQRHLQRVGEPDAVANMANAAALVWEYLPDLNWAGFYRMVDGELVLGPFQGKAACIRIPLGKGVCGTAAATRETQRVEDVHGFPGHIACDAASASELVVPVLDGERLIAGSTNFDFASWHVEEEYVAILDDPALAADFHAHVIVPAEVAAHPVGHWHPTRWQAAKARTALRAAELGCDALFKGTSVDGVYSADPKTSPAAKRFDRITFGEILKLDLRIMDPAAITLARDNGIPVVVFSIRKPGAVVEVVNGGGLFTTVTKD